MVKPFRTLLFAVATLASVDFLYAADISIAPTTGLYKVGSIVPVNIFLSNNQDAINAVSATVSFSKDTLELQSVSKSSSILSLWAEEPSFSNDSGKASFEGGVTNPGFSGSQGRLVSLVFKVKKAGQGLVTVSSGSVLANDGDATNVLGTLGMASFTIAEAAATPVKPKVAAPSSPTPTTSSNVPVITSISYPNSEAWYTTKEASFAWAVPTTVTAVRTLYDAKPVATPNKVYDPPIDNRSFILDADGITYMHVQFKTAAGWGTIANYKFQVDTTPPKFNKAELLDGSVTNSPTPTILVDVTDAVSGIDHIAISVDHGTATTYALATSSLYTAPRQTPGKHSLIITAVDKAGNTSIQSIDYSIVPIATPAVLDFTKNLTTNERLTLSGVTYPRVTVEAAVTLRSKSTGFSLSSLFSRAESADSEPMVETTTSDDTGKYTLIWPKPFDPGIYELKARIIDQKGAPSEYTDGKVIVVENITLIRVGAFVMNWLSLILILILAGIAMVATGWYGLLHFGRFRRKVHTRLQDTKDSLRAQSQGIRRDFEEHRTLLLKTKKKRELTKEEQAILKKFNKRIEALSKEIDEKLSGIE